MLSMVASNASQFKAIPVLRIFDLEKAREFYLDYVGMQIDWQHRFDEDAPIYLQVSMAELVLHLSEHSGDCSPGARVFIVTTDLDALYARLQSRQYKYNRPQIETAPWGDRVLELIDPFANKLLFNQTGAAP